MISWTWIEDSLDSLCSYERIWGLHFCMEKKVYTSMETDKPGPGVTGHEILELGQICLFKTGNNICYL